MTIVRYTCEAGKLFSDGSGELILQCDEVSDWSVVEAMACVGKYSITAGFNMLRSMITTDVPTRPFVF